jgi:hypothetical protein
MLFMLYASNRALASIIWGNVEISDTLTDRRRFLPVVDDFTRESLRLVAGTSLSGARRHVRQHCTWKKQGERPSPLLRKCLQPPCSDRSL